MAPLVRLVVPYTIVCKFYIELSIRNFTSYGYQFHITDSHQRMTIGYIVSLALKAVNSVEFPSGPPAQYWPGLASLSYGVRMGSGVFDAVWSTANHILLTWMTIRRWLSVIYKDDYRLYTRMTIGYMICLCHHSIVKVMRMPLEREHRQHPKCTYVEH